VADDEGERTYGIWWFVAAFVLLGAVGLAALLLVGNSTSETVQLPLDTTTSVTTTTAAPGATTASVTVPGGAPAPEGVREVVSSGGATSYAFTTTEELASVPVRTVVGRATAVPTPEGTSLAVTVDCTVAEGEALAQLSITEDASSVTVLPAVLAPVSAPACVAGTVLRQVTVPLASPIGSRQVVLVPAGTEVPTPVAR
jgi:hypothetical protein